MNDGALAAEVGQPITVNIFTDPDASCPCVADHNPNVIAVHAGKSEETDYDGEAWRAWRRLDLRRSPFYGAVVGTVEITGYHRATKCARVTRPCQCLCHRGGMVAHAVACCSAPYPQLVGCSPWADLSRPDVYHWTLRDPVALDEPIPVRGRQRLWRLPEDVAAAVLAS